MLYNMALNLLRTYVKTLNTVAPGLVEQLTALLSTQGIIGP